MLTFSTENTLSLEPKSPLGVFACSTIYFLLTSPPLEAYARTKQHLLCKTKPISKGLLMNLTSALTSTYEEKPPPEAPKNKANSKPIGKKAATAKLHQIRATSSEVRSSVPIRHLWPGFLRYRQPARTKQHLLCKTKPISEGMIMTVTSALTNTYEHKPPLEAPKNKANPPKRQNQRKPRPHKDLRKNPPLEPKKIKSNLKPNPNPIQSQFQTRPLSRALKRLCRLTCRIRAKP